MGLTEDTVVHRGWTEVSVVHMDWKEVVVDHRGWTEVAVDHMGWKEAAADHMGWKAVVANRMGWLEPACIVEVHFHQRIWVEAHQLRSPTLFPIMSTTTMTSIDHTTGFPSPVLALPPAPAVARYVVTYVMQMDSGSS